MTAKQIVLWGSSLALEFCFVLISYAMLRDIGLAKGTVGGLVLLAVGVLLSLELIKMVRPTAKNWLAVVLTVPFIIFAITSAVNPLKFSPAPVGGTEAAESSPAPTAQPCNDAELENCGGLLEGVGHSLVAFAKSVVLLGLWAAYVVIVTLTGLGAINRQVADPFSHLEREFAGPAIPQPVSQSEGGW